MGDASEIGRHSSTASKSFLVDVDNPCEHVVVRGQGTWRVAATRLAARGSLQGLESPLA